MTDIAINVQGISKAYRIGEKDEKFDTLGSLIASWVKKPIRNFINLRNLSNFSNDKGNDIFWALQDISFTVERGEVLGIIGKNGAGKSTLLKILSRVTEPTKGRIELYGRVASLLEVGTGFNPELTGRENIYLNGTILGMTRKEIDAKFDLIVDFSGIEKFIDTPAKRYSSGMKVRLAFAVAAHLDPEILIIDEVLAVGDAEFQKKCIGKIQEVSGKSGKTVLFVSHDMTAIQNLCSRCICLQTGMIIHTGEPNTVIDKYLSTTNAEGSGFADVKRKGDGSLKVTNIVLYNSDKEPKTNFVCGENIIIEVFFSRKLTAADINSMHLILEIANQMRHKVFSLSNRFSKFDVPDSYYDNKLVCELPNLLLTIGSYNIDSWLSFKGGFADEIRDALEFHVNSANFYGTGLLPAAAKHGDSLIFQQWGV